MEKIVKKIILAGDKINRHSIVSIAGIIENFDPDIKIDTADFKNIDKLKIHPGSVLGFSFFSGQIPVVFPLISHLKKEYPDILSFAGGPHPSGAPSQTIKEGFDYVIRGEGEKSIPLFLEMLAGKNPEDSVPGLSYKKDRKIIHNKAARFINLDQAYNYSGKLGAFFPIEITRGCPYACKFCQVSSLFGKAYRHRSVDSITEHVQKGQKYIRFISTNALAYGAVKPSEINCNEIIKLLESVKRVDKNIELFFGSFPSEAKPEYINKETVGIIKKYTANKIIAIGAQTGSKRLLKKISRRHSVEDVFNAVENINSGGLKSKVDFIFGLPGETRDDLNETFDLMIKLIKMNAEIRIHTFMPLGGSEFSDKKPGKISDTTRDFLQNLIGRGVASGPWLEKDKINREITKYTDEKKKRMLPSRPHSYNKPGLTAS